MPPIRNAIMPTIGYLLRSRHAGEAASVTSAPELTTDGKLQLSSASFPADGVIPRKYSGVGRGENVSPELSWSGAPANTAQYLLIMDDPDVPLQHPVIHFAALFGPDITHFAEGALTADNPALRCIPGAFGRLGYHGPRPLRGHGPHRYIFTLYALDQAIPADQPLPNLEAVLPLVRGHVLARGRLVGAQEG